MQHLLTPQQKEYQPLKSHRHNDAHGICINTFTYLIGFNKRVVLLGFIDEGNSLWNGVYANHACDLSTQDSFNFGDSSDFEDPFHKEFTMLWYKFC